MPRAIMPSLFEDNLSHNLNADAQSSAPDAPKTIHLTLTGFYAGTPLCGHPRKDPAADYAHATYINTDLPQVCPACKQLWDMAEDMTDGNTPT